MPTGEGHRCSGNWKAWVVLLLTTTLFIVTQVLESKDALHLANGTDSRVTMQHENDTSVFRQFWIGKKMVQTSQETDTTKTEWNGNEDDDELGSALKELMDLVKSGQAYHDRDGLCGINASNSSLAPHLITDRVLPESVTHANRKIPKVIHITSRTRCATTEFYGQIDKWKKMTNYSFFLHDDEAVQRLLSIYRSELPNLPMIQACIKKGAQLADLWRFVVLWEYGGIYTDFDNAPGPQLLANDSAIITPEMDAFLTRDHDSGKVSQYFAAMAPKHPLSFLAVQHVSRRILEVPDIGSQYIPVVSGPDALYAAFDEYKQDDEVGQNNETETVRGAAPHFNHTTVTIFGGRYGGNDYVVREAMRKKVKHNYIAAVGINDYERNRKKTLQDDGRSCLESVYERTRGESRR